MERPLDNESVPVQLHRAVKLPWIFPGIPLTFNGLPEISRVVMTSSNGNISALLSICAGNSPVTGEFCAWINGWVNNGEAGDLRHHQTHYDVTVMVTLTALLTQPSSCHHCRRHWRNRNCIASHFPVERIGIKRGRLFWKKINESTFT